MTMNKLLQAGTKAYLVGIKGVGMTSLTQVMLDAGISISGSDLAEEFVTQKILDNLQIKIDIGFDLPLPDDIDLVVYTAAHNGRENPQVREAVEKNIPIMSHAEALGEFFNSKKGVAVCGVGGKSSTSAMIVWILNQLGLNPSFSVGVGEIIGMDKTGALNPQSEWFIAEADEFVIDPTATKRGEALIPRFMSLHPQVTVAKQLLWDHPDVYPTENDYIFAFENFFSQIREGGTLIFPDQKYLPGLKTTASNQICYSDSQTPNASSWYVYKNSSDQKTRATLYLDNKEYEVSLSIPGIFNLDNAVAAVLACREMGILVEDSIKALENFRSTKRRVEYVGQKNGVIYYDDYAHHPHEIKSIIESFNAWFPGKRVVYAFQPHTYSRTKELFEDFVKTLSVAKNLLILDIFASAREKEDSTISSAMLAEEIKNQGKDSSVKHFAQISELADYCKAELNEGDVLVTLGAGDIYQVHDMI